MRKLITKTMQRCLIFCSLLASVGLAAQSCPSGKIGGHIFQDFNFNGLADEISTTGLAGITVVLYKPQTGGGSITDGTTTTDANGDWSFTGKTDGLKYRVEFILPPALAAYQSTFFGGANGTTVQFITAPNCSVGAAFAVPEDYCLGQPVMGIPCYVNGSATGGGTASKMVGLIGFPYGATGINQTFNIEIDSIGSVGACWGLAYQKESKTLFSASVLRRHSGFGPGGPGAIYVHDLSGPLAFAPKIGTIDLVALGVPIAADPRILNPLPPNVLTPNFDSLAFPLIGKYGIGDIDISADGKNLWVMCLSNRTLYRIFVNNPFVMPTAANVTAFPLTNPGCGNNNDWRPWGLKVYRDEVFVGMVCTAETSQTPSQLHAFVKKLNGGGTFDPVFDFPIDYTRGKVFSFTAMNKWNPWTNNWALMGASGNVNYPQPLLSDIEFDVDGSLILGFLDRTAFQGGFMNYGPSYQYNSIQTTFSGGDLVRACKNSSGGWDLEGSTAACKTSLGMMNGEGPGGGEFYWDERAENSFSNPGMPFLVHNETALGGLALVSGLGQIASTVFDPIRLNTGGVAWFNNTTGKAENEYEIYPDLFGFAGKSTGVGDIEAFCAPAPIEKGNFVWNDANKDGIQDPQEKPIPGVNVSLFDNDCQLLATVQTNAKGEYYFNGATPMLDTIFPNTTYYIVVGTGGQFAGGVLFDSLALTQNDIGTGANPNQNDSDGTIATTDDCMSFAGLPFVKFESGGAGSVDHTCDFGFRAACDISIETVVTTDESCAGKADGKITITASGANSISYSLNGGAFQTMNMFSPLAAGSYKIVVKDVANATCKDSTTAVINAGLLVPPPTGAMGFQICQGGSVPAGSGLKANFPICQQTSLTWFLAAMGGASVGSGSPFNPVASGLVNANVPGMYTFYVQGNCGGCSSSRVPVVFTVYPTPTNPTVSNFEICQFEIVPQSAGLTASCGPCPAGLMQNISWWTAQTGGSQVGSGPTFNPVFAGLISTLNPGTTTYFAQCECGPCVSGRVAATFTVWPLPMPEITGEKFPCPNSDYTYTTPFHAGSTWIWTSTAGSLVINQTGNSATVNFGPSQTTPVIISVKETDLHGCMKTATLSVIIRPTSVLCSNNINLGLNEKCMAVITPNLVLYGNYPTYDGYTITIKDEFGNILLGNKITGKGNFSIKVTEPCIGNSCWATLKTEDKVGPKLTCTDKTVPCSTVDIDPIIPNLTGMPTVVNIGGIGGVKIEDNCGIVDISYSDNLTDFDCNGPTGVSAKVTRVWVATDMSGNHSVCTQMITFQRKMTGDVKWPDDYTTYQCHNPSTSPLTTGVPTIDGLSIWPDVQFCEMSVSYNDQILTVCDGTFKILRTWIVYDWCKPTGLDNPLTHLQIIKIIDNAGPIVACPASYEHSTDADRCTASIDLPDVLATDYCSRIKSAKAVYTLPNWTTVTVNATINNFAGNNPWNPDTLLVYPTITEIPVGQTVVKYIVEDDCGNTTVCTFSIEVKDKVPPVNICLEFTKVALGANGEADVPAQSFDAGSYDYCSPVFFKVKRMWPSACDLNPKFDDKTKFCCTDINDTVQVILRTYDQPVWPGKVDDDYLEGHFDDCMVQVFIEDKLKPICNAPSAVTVSCDAFDPTLWAYGDAIAKDNCSVDTVLYSINKSLFEEACKKGIINRVWTVFDHAGNTSRCTQKITVVPETNFTVKFPDDKTLSNCNASGDYGQPIISGENCELIGVNFKDQIFTLVPDACYKILRTWKILNWCDFDSNWSPLQIDNPANSVVGPVVAGNATNHGYFVYTQIIKIQDVVAPVITCPTSPVVFEDFSDNDPLLFADVHHDFCEGSAPLTAQATDLCSKSDLTFRYILKLDLDGDGVMETTWQSSEPGRPAIEISKDSLTAFAKISTLVLPYGKHKVKWIVEDGCGNNSACEYDFTIKDAKKPTITCKSGLSVNLMQTGMIQIWASDFLLYAFDNCSPVYDLEYGVRKNGTGSGFTNDPSVTFSCDDLGTNSIELWAKDKAGNADFCATYLIITDNVGACSNTSTVAGSITNTQLKGVQDVEVKITGQQVGLPSPSFFTGLNGNYNFAGIPLGDNYKIEPLKNVNPLNGVSTLDLVAISKHILGVKPFDSPYKWVAADINHNGAVTTFDIVELRKMILGIYSSFPQNSSWRFVEKNFNFDLTQIPLQQPFKEAISLNDFDAALTNGDFFGVKIGDLTGDAMTNNLEQTDDRNPVGQLVFDLDEQPLKMGEVIEVPFRASQLAQVLGYQFSLSFDPQSLALLDLKTSSRLASLSLENFGLQQLADGLISTSWNGSAAGFPPTENLFTLRFLVKKEGVLSQNLHLSSRLTAAEAYDSAERPLDVALRFTNKNGEQTTATVGFELYQNQPNPFSDRTQIGFHLPTASDATLRIFNATGQLIFEEKGSFSKGFQAIWLDKNNLAGNGIYYYELSTPSATATRKLILNR